MNWNEKKAINILETYLSIRSAGASNILIKQTTDLLL